ncbi:ATP-dependent Clp protease ATP-binding subunit [Candidatus Gottesmanbacteria bacterium]|nr:ATP-dependent Clp protease ATP-binding subunit [Candidatus Gottesmanbacteria bacterium]
MNFLSQYLDWHYITVWAKLFLIWRNLFLFPWYYFGVTYHLRNLLSPWKRQVAKKGVGLRVGDILSVLGFNLISRGIGASIRTFTILYGLVLMSILGVFGALLTLSWLFIPFITIPFYTWRSKTDLDEVKKILGKAHGDMEKFCIYLFSHQVSRFILSRLGIHPDYVIDMLKQLPAKKESIKTYIPNVEKLKTIADCVIQICKAYPPFVTLFSRKKIDAKDLDAVVAWYTRLNTKPSMPLIFDLPRIQGLPCIGHAWNYGYTVSLDSFSKDLTRSPSPYPFLVGREKEIEEMQRVLLKNTTNNIIIVGEPGVARHLLVETLAHRMQTGEVIRQLARQRILSLDMHSILASKPTIAEAKGVLSDILEEGTHAGNVNVVIDEIDKYTSSGDGRIDLTDVLEKFAESSVGVIGITTPSEYHRYIEVNAVLTKLFEKIEVKQPPLATVLEELELSIVPVLEAKHRIYVTYQALKKVLEDADKYISNTPFPGKAIELLDQTAVYVVTQKLGHLLKPNHVDEFLAKKLNIPLGDLKSGEREKLLNLEEGLHQYVINQHAAIAAIASSLRRSRLTISNPNKPIGTFLFLGPTGVGKTETAKALCRVYYGSPDFMARFDMSQYQKEEGIERLIGSVKLGTPGELTSYLRSRPFSLILLDEVEKADPQIFNLLLTLLDEGYITDAFGRQVNAKNTIIIATSNAAAEFIRQNINKGTPTNTLQKLIIEHILTEKIFSPEFINRFDAAVVFTPLSEGNLREVARLMLADLNKRLRPKEISVAVTDDLVATLSQKGFDPQFGGRAMRRTISSVIEDQIAQKLLEGNIKKGEEIHITL